MHIVLTPDEVKKRLALDVAASFDRPVIAIVVHKHGGMTLEMGEPEDYYPDNMTAWTEAGEEQ